jgi:aminopeptidase N
MPFRSFIFAVASVLLSMGLLQAQQVDVYSRPIHYERSRDYDVLHYRIHLTVDKAKRSFWGDTTISLKPLRDDFSTCVLDAETFIVSKVESEAHQPLRFVQTETSLTVYLPHPYAYGQPLSFVVYYREDDPHVDPQKYGMHEGYDLGLTFKSATPDHPSLASTLSFPEGARHWFPSYDYPDDKATSDTIITADQSDQVISNGRLVSVTEAPQTHQKTFHWSQDKPISTYLFVLAVGPYVKVKDSLGNLPVDYWVYQQSVPDARRSFHNTPGMIKFFGEEFGYPYPWVKYDQIILPHFTGGAESTSATVVGDDIIHDAKADSDFPSDWLVAHELAHQWWGDLITMRDWSQAWLNEGFATYFQYVYTRHELGSDEGAVDLQDKINQYLAESHKNYQRPIVFNRWQYPNDNFDLHIYQKGAAVLSMLNWTMGDSDFRRAISYFLHKHAFQPVDTHDLQDAIMESTGQNLDWFFEQWVYKAGHPVFDVNYQWNESARKVILEVTQTQQSSDRVPVFQTPVVIGITTPSAKHSYRVWIRKQEEHFEFQCPEKPLLVRFDEGNHVLKEMTFPKGVGELEFQLQKDDVIGRMWAASQLSQHLADSGVADALKQSATEDPFWAVRRAAIQALSPSSSAADISFLEKRALDPKSAVRVAALRALGDLHEHSLESFFQERYKADESYLAEAEALRSIGKCKDSSVIPFLQEASLRVSPANVIHTAAQDAMKMLAIQ